MLHIENLHANIGDKEILRGINLHIPDGEIHAIMGPNGGGKSTLANVLTGRPPYEPTQGSVTFNGENLLEMSPSLRAQKGLMMSFQYPVEIPGVSMTSFLRAALNAKRKQDGKEPVKAADFLKLLKEKQKQVKLPSDLMKRFVNQGFSGGEKKRNEIFQMLVLEPSLAILDETDSGLDIDALRTVAEGVNSMRSSHFSAIVITHYQRLLDYIRPDVIHVLMNGEIIRTGGPKLALELEDKGYDWLREEQKED